MNYIYWDSVHNLDSIKYLNFSFQIQGITGPFLIYQSLVLMRVGGGSLAPIHSIRILNLERTLHRRLRGKQRFHDFFLLYDFLEQDC